VNLICYKDMEFVKDCNCKINFKVYVCFICIVIIHHSEFNENYVLRMATVCGFCGFGVGGGGGSKE
jgi:hypothetical protein